MEDKVYLSLSEILDAKTPYDIFLEPFNKIVKIRNATVKDRLEAERLARKNPGWSEMSKEERDLELGKMLALQILQEPKITYEQYLESDDALIQILLASVANEYYKRILSLSEKIKRGSTDFLPQKSGADQENSTKSLN